MRLKQKILVSGCGFAMVEMVLSIVITAAVSIGMFYIFTEVNRHLVREHTRTEVINYCNDILDEIVDSIRVCDNLYRGQFGGFQKLTIITEDNNGNAVSTEYKFDTRDGFLKNSNPLKHYFAIDNQKQQQYQLTDWGCRIPNADPGEDNTIRMAKNYCYMNIDIMDIIDDNKIIETLDFKREVFSSAIYLKSLGI